MSEKYITPEDPDYLSEGTVDEKDPAGLLSNLETSVFAEVQLLRAEAYTDYDNDMRETLTAIAGLQPHDEGLELVELAMFRALREKLVQIPIARDEKLAKHT